MRPRCEPPPLHVSLRRLARRWLLWLLWLGCIVGALAFTGWMVSNALGCGGADVALTDAQIDAQPDAYVQCGRVHFACCPPAECFDVAYAVCVDGWCVSRDAGGVDAARP